MASEERTTYHIDLLVDLNNQSKLITEGGDTYRVSNIESGEGAQLSCGTAYPDGSTRTLLELFQRGHKLSNDGPALGWHDTPTDPYKWLSYGESLTRMKNVGSGFVQKGLKPCNASFIGIYSQNCPEWVLAQYGGYHYSMVPIPIYDTLGPDACNYIINQAQISLVVVDTETKVRDLLSSVQDGQIRSLQTLVHIKPMSNDIIEFAQLVNVELISFQELEKQGEKANNDTLYPKPSDLSIICYTSGTTGTPKGVMLTHANIVACAHMTYATICPSHRCGTGDVIMSFLPLAHIFEQGGEAVLFYGGGAVGFFSGDIKNLIHDMQALRPTICPMVPRLLNRIYDGVINDIQSSLLKRIVFRLAMASKERQVNNQIVTTSSWADKIVFNKIQAKLGGRLRTIFAASAPLSPVVMNFARCALGCVIVEAYGQTESTGPCTITICGDPSTGHVGPPMIHCRVKLADVPDMNYWAKDNQGEVCVKGPNVFVGYFKEPEKTAEVFDEDGWLRTGDIGMWMPNGTLKIIDKKKHLFKLSQGEYIAPEKIENIYLRSAFVSQIFVHGDSYKSCLVAIVVPDESEVKKWAKANKVETSSVDPVADLCRVPALKSLIFDDLQRTGKAHKLNSLEQVKDIFLCSQPFTIENELLTPTLKTRRPNCRKYFQTEIENMYKTLY